MAGKAWWQECEMAGHIVSAAWKQRDIIVGVYLDFSFYSAHGTVLPTIRISLLSSVKPFGKLPHRHTQRCASMVILNLVKRTTKKKSSCMCFRGVIIGILDFED